MGLESGTYIDSLVVTNPTAGDLKSEGDDHIRLIKATIKATFPNVTSAVTAAQGHLSGVSPVFTGTPTAPTAAAADNSTQIATTAYVDATFVSEAYPPIAGNSGKFLTTDGNITSWEDVYTETESDAKYAPLASPVLTGVPTAPTAAADTNTTQLATTAFVTTEANLKADLASPTLTGTPAAPTATAGTNTTQIATTAFVTTADNLKADLASPTLTGTPVAPTATAGTNTTQVATTAFVTTAVAAANAADVPIGGSILWDLDTMPTTGTWKPRIGTAISRTTYSELFALCGEQWGAGDSSTTFNIPDNRGEFPRMQDLAAGVDPDAATRTDRGDLTTGDEVGTKQAEGFKSHTHVQYGGSYAAVTSGGTSNFNGTTGGATWTNVGSTGGNQTVPVNFNTLFIMRVL